MPGGDALWRRMTLPDNLSDLTKYTESTYSHGGTGTHVSSNSTLDTFLRVDGTVVFYFEVSQRFFC